MALTRKRHQVCEVGLGAENKLGGGRLTVNGDAVAAVLQAVDDRLAAVRTPLARPDEATRFDCVKDVVRKLKIPQPDMGRHQARRQ